MNLIVIYGPPASGKLTIAQQLADITGYKLFHNHLTVDAADSLFEWMSPPFVKYCQESRILGIKLAMENNISLITTLAYAPEDRDFVLRIQGLPYYYTDININWVKLITPMKELKKRVIAKSRQKYKKIRTVKGLNKFCNQYDAFQSIPLVDSIEVNTTKLNPKEAAEYIVKQINKV